MSLKIAINAQLVPGTGAGGTEAALVGLVNALARLDGPEQYVLVGPWEEPDWLKPYIGQNQVIVRGPKIQALKRALGPVRPLVKLARRASAWISGSGEAWPRLANSHGFFEGLGCSVVHFPYQQYIVSALPAVFNPYDLQHIHYPQFFSPADVKWREVTYSAACRAAHTVVVHSDWVKQDVAAHYQIDPGKIQIVLLPPPTQVYTEPTPGILDALNRTYRLSSPFALYPAMTWEHKNHLRLLEALALLRDRRGIRVELICTGHQTDFFPRIRTRMKELQLDDQVRFLGMVPAEDLRGLYRLAQFVIFPTLFEGAGLPLLEAWNEGTPIACAAVTSVLEHAGDAALLFDPLSVEAIADAVARMASDDSLRETLKKLGSVRLRLFNWETAASAYRAVYRRAAGHPLNEEDRCILRGGQG